MAHLTATSYSELNDLLGTKDHVKIGNNTYAQRGYQNVIRIRLHSTYIVKLAPNGNMKIDSGGYHTVTTKDRINQFLPQRYGLCQRDWHWYLFDREDDFREIPFFDGMMFTDGVLTYENPWDES